ncbi:MAG: hypothetical protein QXY40_05015 [Candidatus Methanomethylicia archaeon]
MEGFIGGWKSRGYGYVVFKCNKISIHDVSEMLKGLLPLEYEEGKALEFVSKTIVELGGG